VTAEEVRVKAVVGDKATSRGAKESPTIGNETLDQEDAEILDGQKSSMTANSVFVLVPRLST